MKDRIPENWDGSIGGVLNVLLESGVPKKEANEAYLEVLNQLGLTSMHVQAIFTRFGDAHSVGSSNPVYKPDEAKLNL